MPRYRFSWTNLVPELSRGLAKALELPGTDAPGALRSYYGARPQDDFMKDAWRPLIDLWLAKDAESRRNIVDELKAIGLGETGQSTRTAANQLSYLRSCRNSKTLREVVLAYFIVMGENPSAGRVAPSQPPDRAQQPVGSPNPKTRPRSTSPDVGAPAASLCEWIKGVLSGQLDGGEAIQDEDGDFPIRHGSAVVFVRPIEGSESKPLVHFFSPMVSEIDPTAELFVTLNELNLQLPMAKVALTSAHQVHLIYDLPGLTLGAEEFLSICALMCDMADSLDTRIRKSFGGQTMLDDVDDAVEV